MGKNTREAAGKVVAQDPQANASPFGISSGADPIGWFLMRRL